MKPLFKKIITVSILAVLIGAALFLILSFKFESKYPSKTILTTQGAYDGLQLTMTLEKTKYTLREPINLTMTLTNISNQNISLTWGDGCGYDFRVYNGTNSTVYLSSWPPLPDRTIPTLTFPLFWTDPINAGQNISSTLSWQQDGWNTYVLPGTYYIVGQFGSMIYNNQTSVTIETTPMQITIS